MNQNFTILFDLDGTLVNTAPDLMHAHNYVMKKYGFQERQLSDIRKLAGRGSKVMLTRSINELSKTSEVKNNHLGIVLHKGAFINCVTYRASLRFTQLKCRTSATTSYRNHFHQFSGHFPLAT